MYLSISMHAELSSKALGLPVLCELFYIYIKSKLRRLRQNIMNV